MNEIKEENKTQTDQETWDFETSDSVDLFRSFEHAKINEVKNAYSVNIDFEYLEIPVIQRISVTAKFQGVQNNIDQVKEILNQFYQE